MKRKHVDVRAGEKQCPAVAQFDGANCCALIEGHDGEHENTFGSTYPNETWGTSEEWAKIQVSHYATLSWKPRVVLSNNAARLLVYLHGCGEVRHSTTLGPVRPSRDPLRGRVRRGGVAASGVRRVTEKTYYVCHGMYGCDTGCCGYRLCLDDEGYEMVPNTRFTFSHPRDGQSPDDFARDEWPEETAPVEYIEPGKWWVC